MATLVSDNFTTICSTDYKNYNFKDFTTHTKTQSH